MAALMTDSPSVSTHSRPKAAGDKIWLAALIWRVSTHSRPKAAGISLAEAREKRKVSTHSRPKAAGGYAASGLAGF